MFNDNELATNDIQTLVGRTLHQVATMIWQEHRDRDDVLHHIFDRFYTTEGFYLAQPRYCEDNWRAVLTDDMKTLGCPCSIERETDSMRSQLQNSWIAHLPHFDFWITESKNMDEITSDKFLSFFPPSRTSLFSMNDWKMNAISAQRLAFIDFHYDTICKMLDQEMLKASRLKQMTEILETTWGASVNAETRRLTEGVHSQSDDFSFSVRYLEKRCQIKVAISESWMETGWYSRDRYTLDIPYERLCDSLPVYIDAILAGNIDCKDLSYHDT